MTAQREDKISWGNINYILQGYCSEKSLHRPPFSPKDHGVPILEGNSTDCYRGFVCNYTILNKLLFLSDLEFYCDGSECPTLNGVAPEPIKRGRLVGYTDISMPLKYTGRMRLADGLISTRFRGMGFQDPTSYEKIFDLEFIDGALTSYKDLSSCFDDMRKVQDIVDDYLKKNYVPPRVKRNLHETFAFGRTDIVSQFSNSVDSFDPNMTLRILDKIEESKKDIRWFIECYLAHYEELHTYSHTFKQLEYLGAQSQLVKVLTKIKGNLYSEESVVLALLKVLLEVEADRKWGNVLPVVFERQIIKAHLSHDLIEKVRGLISELYR